MGQEENFALKSIEGAVVSRTEVLENLPQGANRDEVELARFGKLQQLKRNFGLISTVGLTCTLMITWEGMLCTFAGGLTNGGSAGLVYAFIFSFVGNILQALVMAEMASMIPLAGGQYNWVSVLSPPWCSKFLSYLTGWLTVIAWQAATASTAYFGGTLIQGLVIMSYPDYTPTNWQGTLMFYAILGVALFINTYLARILPKIEALILLVHLIGFFCVLIPLVYLAPHSSASDVFQEFNNGGGWPTDGLSFFIGASTPMFAFVGIDAASHIAEEIKDASIIIPRSMISSVMLNGVLGFAMTIAVLFCIGNLEDALSAATGFPFMEIFQNATNSVPGATGMASIVVVIFIFACVGLMASASRMTWAFAREKGLPGYKYLSRVDARSALPLWSIGVTVLINMLLALINIGSTTAFNAFVSLVVSSFYSSFLMSACVLLNKRLKTPNSEMPWGPFSLGRFGIPIIIASIIYTVIGIFFSFFPAAAEVTPLTMNWSVLVFGAAMIFSLIFWVAHGRKVYTGPIMETSVTRVIAES